MKEKFSIKVEDKTYCVWSILLVGYTYAEAAAFADKKLGGGGELSKEDRGSDATTFDRNGCSVVWVRPGKIGVSILCHEIVHVVSAIFGSRGILMDINNDEPFAYLHGMFIREFLKKIPKKLLTFE